MGQEHLGKLISSIILLNSNINQIKFMDISIKKDSVNFFFSKVSWIIRGLGSCDWLLKLFFACFDFLFLFTLWLNLVIIVYFMNIEILYDIVEMNNLRGQCISPFFLFISIHFHLSNRNLAEIAYFCI